MPSELCRHGHGSVQACVQIDVRNACYYRVPALRATVIVATKNIVQSAILKLLTQIVKTHAGPNVTKLTFGAVPPRV
jgi:hypothetical protein